MYSNEYWRERTEIIGGKPFSSRVYAKEEIDNFDVLDYHWTSKTEDYIKIRNKWAKKLREDGYTVKSSSSSCMGLKFAILEARRSKDLIITHSNLSV
jgi:hypothetical protein